MFSTIYYFGWTIAISSIFGTIWIILTCLQHKKRCDVNEQKNIENDKTVKRNKLHSGSPQQNETDEDVLPNGRPRSHDQRELPDIPHPTVANSTAVTRDEDDDVDESHYDIIPRQLQRPVETVPRNPYDRVVNMPAEEIETDSTYAPVGSDITYSGVRDFPSAVMSYEDDSDPNYAGIGDDMPVRRVQPHNYETVDATYAQVLDRGQRLANAQNAEAVTTEAIVTVTPVGDYDLGVGSASGKEARYFKVTAREPLADLRRRQAEERAEADRLREAAYATVGDIEQPEDKRASSTPTVTLPAASRTSQYSEMYAEIGDVKEEPAQSSSVAPEPPPVHTLKQLTASTRHEEGAEAGYSSVEYRRSKVRSLPRSVQSVELHESHNGTAVYSVVDKKRKDKTTTVHVDNDVSQIVPHLEDMYARVNKPSRRHNSTRSGSDGATAAMKGSRDWKVSASGGSTDLKGSKQSNEILKAAASLGAAGDPRLFPASGNVKGQGAISSKTSVTQSHNRMSSSNGYHLPLIDDDPGYSKCEDVFDSQEPKGIVADFDPNYELISNMISFSLNGQEQRSNVKVMRSSSARQAESILLNQLQRPKTWAPANGLVTRDSSSTNNNNSTTHSSTTKHDQMVWQKREPIYQDIEEVSMVTSVKL